MRVGVDETSYHDGQEWRVGLTHGFDFAKGKGRALLTADFYHRASILARVRDFAAESDHSNLAPAPWDIPNTATSATAAGVFNSRSATIRIWQFPPRYGDRHRPIRQRHRLRVHAARGRSRDARLGDWLVCPSTERRQQRRLRHPPRPRARA